MPVIPAPKERRQENQELKATSSTHQVCGQLESSEREGETLSLLLLEIPQFTPSTSRAGTPGLQDPPPCESFPAWVFSALVFTPRRSDTFELLEKHCTKHRVQERKHGAKSGNRALADFGPSPASALPGREDLAQEH